MNPEQAKRFKADPLAFIESLVIPSGRGIKRFKECMFPFQRTFFEQMRPILIALANGTEPPINRVWLERTKGGSKDSDVACCILWVMAFAKKPVRGRICASDRDQAGEVWLIVKGLLRHNPWLADRITLQNWKIICEANDSECEVISADADSAHGGRVDITFLNELVHHQNEDFASTIADDAAKMPFGVMVIASNAGIQNSWAHSWKKNAEENPDVWLMSVMSEPSPWLNAKDIEDARRREPKARFERLWYGVWSSASSACLSEEDIQAALNYNLRPQAGAEPGYVYVAGLDLGISNDHSALAVIGIARSTQRFRLVYTREWSPDETSGKVNLMDVEQECLEVYKRFRPVRFGYDAWQAVLLAQRCELQGIPMEAMQFSSKGLTLMAQTLIECFQNRRIELYNIPKLITDLRRLQIEERPFGVRLTSTRDSEGHQDLATALIIALPFAVEEAKVNPPEIGAVDLLDPKGFSGLSLYQIHLQEMEEERALREEEDRLLNTPEDPNEGFVAALNTFLGY
jgi:phage terminase large subunit-like protein